MDSHAPTPISDLIPPLPRESTPTESPRPQAVARPRQGGARPHVSSAPILVAVADPVLHSEVTTIVAATGRQRLDTTDPADIARHGHRSSAVVIDHEAAREIGPLAVSVPVFVVCSEPGPIDWKLAMQMRAEEAFVLPAQAPELLRALGRGDHPPEGNFATVVVCGAAGGVGASTLAAALARSHDTCVLLDADPCSGGLDLLLGVEDSLGIRWSDLDFTRGQLEAEELLSALPHAGQGVRLLTHARTDLGLTELSPEQVAGAVACLRGHATVIIDTPAHGECFTAACEASDLVVVMIPAEVRGAAAAHALVGHLVGRRCRVVGVLRYRGWSGLGRQDIEELVKVEVVAEVPTLRRLPKQVETAGLPAALPKALAQAAQAVGEVLAA